MKKELTRLILEILYNKRDISTSVIDNKGGKL